MKFVKNSVLVIGASLAASSAMSQTFCQDVINAQDVLNGSTFGLCTTPAGTGASKRTDKNLYMGLVWSFGPKASKTPDVLVGFRSIDVNSSNKVSGVDLSLRLKNVTQFTPEGVRLSYVGGQRDSLANIGAGYSFSANQALLTGAVQTSYLRAGSDYLLANKSFAPYLELNTLQRIKPAGTPLSCSPEAGSLRTVSQNISAEQAQSFQIGNGLTTADAAFTLAQPSLGPFLPAGSKTCYLEQPAPVL